MLNLETSRNVRQAHLQDGKGIREIARQFSLFHPPPYDPSSAVSTVIEKYPLVMTARHV